MHQEQIKEFVERQELKIFYAMHRLSEQIKNPKELDDLVELVASTQDIKTMLKFLK